MKLSLKSKIIASLNDVLGSKKQILSGDKGGCDIELKKQQRLLKGVKTTSTFYASFYLLLQSPLSLLTCLLTFNALINLCVFKVLAKSSFTPNL